MIEKREMKKIKEKIDVRETLYNENRFDRFSCLFC